MDIEDFNVNYTKSYNHAQPTEIYDNVNIAFNPSNSMMVHWNKYQIFVYENIDDNETAKMIAPEYLIQSLILTNNYILCVDTNGNVHITTLKLKNNVKILMSSFEPRDKGLKTCVAFSPDHSLSLKHDSGTYFLCINEINTDFRLKKSVALTYNEEPVNTDNYLLKIHNLRTSSSEIMKIFGIEMLSENCNLILVSFDRQSVLGCVLDMRMNEVTTNLVTLYTCPSEICDFLIQDSHIHIGLKIGTIICLPLNSGDKEYIVHLNSALHRLAVVNEAYIYTNGTEMWKADNIFSEMTFKQFVVKSVYDFTVIGDFVLCTTFDKTNHKLSLIDDDSFLKSFDQEYSSAEEVINNSEYLNKIFKEIDKDQELARRMNEEWYYLNALALSKRHDLMDKAIETNVKVYENYMEAINEIPGFTLTEDISHYFGNETYSFLVQIGNVENIKPLSNVVADILANVDTHVHITILNQCETLKTTSIKITELKKLNFLVPCRVNPLMNLNMNIKFASKIPDNCDKKQRIFSILYKKQMQMNSENFIRTNTKYLNSRKSSKDFEQQILKTCTNQYGDLFHFADTSKRNRIYTKYINWPKNFELKSKIEYFNRIFSIDKSNFLLQRLTSKEFLQSKESITLLIGDEEVNVALENDGFSTPQLKVAGENIKIVLELRNFFSNIIHEPEPGTRLINYSLYTTVENVQKEANACITNSGDSESMEQVAHQFEKNIMGVLPI